MTTREARHLERWLRGVADGSTPTIGAGSSEVFLEPVLHFDLDDRTKDGARILAYFSLEALPPWFEEADRLDIDEFFVPLEMALGDVARAAREWGDELADFPER